MSKSALGGRVEWPRILQAIIGMFFIAAAYEKLTDSFFGLRTAPLGGSLSWWLSQNWPAPGYHQFLTLMLPYADYLAAAVIALQATAGLSLFLDVKKRWGSLILFFVQLNIFLGTIFGGIGFLTFVGLSLWLALYYFFQQTLTKNQWKILTYLMILIGVAMLYRRYTIGDPWTSSFGWQESHFAADVMGISPTLKAFVIRISETSFGPYLWASMWWIQAALFILMFTRYRLYAGAVWLLILLGRTWIWLNGVTGEGTLWVLTVFAWVIAEEEWQRTHHGVIALLPSKENFVDWWVQTKKKLQPTWCNDIEIRCHAFGYTWTLASLFFAAVTAMIVIAFVMPAAFGLQNFNQWGGMYDDHWCHVEVASANPHVVTGALLLTENENAGETQTRWVFTAPMHNHGTCLMWGRTRCGQVSSAGWPIAWVNVSMNDDHFAGTNNVCDLPPTPAFSWFPHDL